MKKDLKVIINLDYDTLQKYLLTEIVPTIQKFAMNTEKLCSKRELIFCVLLSIHVILSTF